MKNTMRKLLIAGLLAGCLVGVAAPAKAVTAEHRYAASKYRELGLAYRDQGQFSAAIAALEKSVELDPDNLSGRVNLGWMLHLNQQDRQAADVLQQTIAIDPFNVETFNALGIVYLVNNDLPGAVLMHSWAALLAPENEIPHYNLSLAFQRLQKYDQAIAAAQKACTLEPDNPHPFVALAIAQWGKGDKPAAQQSYQQAIGIDARYRDAEFLNYLDEAGFSADQIALSKQILGAP